MPAKDYGETTACPECGSPNVYQRTQKTPRWRCPDCNAEFELPIIRERQAGRKADQVLQREIEAVREARRDHDHTRG